MKFKALRTKREPKEFVLLNFQDGSFNVYTSELPNPQPMTATIEGMKEYFSKFSDDELLPEDFNLDDFELVEIEAYEADTVGADIRNKLSSPLNLAVMMERYLEAPEKNEKLLELIKKEIEHTKNCVEYIANLL